MFRGSHDHVLDDKGRVSLPKEFRVLLADRKGEPSFAPLRGCIAIYPADVYEALTAKLASASQVVDRIQKAQRLIIGMSAPCPIDRAGRILIPGKLREWAHLRREIVLMGVGNRIEIWDRERHAAELHGVDDDYAEYMEGLREFGV